MAAQSPAGDRVKVKVGIIGGSGLDDPDILENRTEKHVETPFGKPSDVLIEGQISGVDCVLLARHGRNHSIAPSRVPYRANVWALKQEGCTHILVSTACGSLQEEIKPGDFVILDQFIDRTQGREQSFYDWTHGGPKGICHIPLHTPFCSETRKLVIETAKELNIHVHKEGTAITIQGPRFSSRAESKLWKSWGAHVINMTTVPEVILAKEAGLCYAAIAMATDYDSWRDVEPDSHVTVEAVLKIFRENAEKAKDLILKSIPKIAEKNWDTVLNENKKHVNGAIMGV